MTATELRGVDADVHREVMGLYACDRLGFLVCPHYSTDIAAAWLVVEKMKNGNPDDDSCAEVLFVRDQRTWFCSFEFGKGEYGDTAPLAICLAALNAVRSRNGQ